MSIKRIAEIICIHDPKWGLASEIEAWHYGAAKQINEEMSETPSRHEAEQGEGLIPCGSGCKSFPCVWKYKSEECLRVIGIRPTPTKPTEPLAVLADRKGYYIENILTPDFNHGWGETKEWDLRIGKVKGNDWKQFKAPTYAQAEQAARAYLEGLTTKADAK